MEYAKDEIFNIHYKDVIRKRKTSNILNTIKKNKFMQLIIGITIILCTANILFIYNFFSVLSKI